MRKVKQFILRSLAWLLPAILVITYAPSHWLGMLRYPILISLNAFIAVGVLRLLFPRLAEMMFLVDAGANTTTDQKLTQVSNYDYNAFQLSRFTLAYVIFFTIWSMLNFLNFLTS